MAKNLLLFEPRKDNLDFVGRQDIRRNIHPSLLTRPANPGQGQRIFALSRLGGLSKTQITIKYATTYQNSYRVILWANCDEIVKSLDGYTRFSVKLGLIFSQNSDSSKSTALLKDWLVRTGEHLNCSLSI